MDSSVSGFTEQQWQSVHGACLRRLRNWHLAEEAAQRVFVLALRKRKLEDNPLEHSGWLLRTADWVCREIQRGERRREYHERQAAQNHSQLQPIQNCPAHDYASDLNGALDSLSAGDRALIQQRFLEKLPYRAIGKFVGLSEAAVEKRVSRALLRMRLYFKRRGIELTNAVLPLLLMTKRFAGRSRAVAKALARPLLLKQSAVAAAIIITLLTAYAAFSISPPPAYLTSSPQPQVVSINAPAPGVITPLPEKTPVAALLVVPKTVGVAAKSSENDDFTIALRRDAPVTPPAEVAIKPTVDRNPPKQEEVVIATTQHVDVGAQENRKRQLLSAAQRVNNAQNRLQKAYKALGELEVANGAIVNDITTRLQDIDQRMALVDAQLAAKPSVAAFSSADASGNGKARLEHAALAHRANALATRSELQQEKAALAQNLADYKSDLAKRQFEVNAAKAEVAFAESELAALTNVPPALASTPKVAGANLPAAN